MINLEYFNGVRWVPAASFPFYREELAWISLGGDDKDYRTIDLETGKVLTDKSDQGTEE